MAARHHCSQWQICAGSPILLNVCDFIDDIPAPVWIASGVICGIASAACTVVGMLLQKMGHARENRLLLCVGFLVFTVGKPGTQIAALFCAPVMLIAPLSSASILLNAVIVPFFQETTLTRFQILLGTTLVAGCVGTTLTGSHASNSWSYSEIMGMFVTNIWLTSTLFASLLVLCSALKVGKPWLSAMPLGMGLMSLCPSIASAVNNVMLKVLMVVAPSAPWYVDLSIFLTIALSAFLQVWSTNMCVQVYDLSAFVPIQVSEQILVTTIYSSIFFDETPSNLVAFAMSAATIMSAVCLSQYRDHGNTTIDDDYLKLDSGDGKPCPGSPGSTRYTSKSSAFSETGISCHA